MDKITSDLIKGAIGYSYRRVKPAILLEDGTITIGEMTVCSYLISRDYGIVVSENGQVCHYDGPAGEFETDGLKQAIEFGLNVERRRAEIESVIAKANWRDFRETRVTAELMTEALGTGALVLAEQCAKRLCVEQAHLAKYLAMRKG